ncbi:A/G-specific adenine glycosylase [Croceicoccus sp. F390]|uniref:Adenine DNA glycosylase n=1 Tax=Croceicoccus esteveae TaxID=3075597 RepID=A0ABU2ZGN9_9SPHN|nr:A/G-specific adenine glycosylase [Croceicoccus sp. F390]MDT0574769.1 A/G-specific adenine glycosylase [Croceicoccus sp. F390]
MTSSIRLPTDAALRSAVPSALYDWYKVNARTLPWRVPPHSQSLPDPYHVWLSEIMLQQTTVAAAIPYFQRFIERWSDVGALAATDEADVMAAWAGLGYYARARNLVRCARLVAASGGLFPDNEETLRALPGIGAYTAAAIAAIAFGRRAVVVDANVERVVARLFAVAEPLPGARSRIRTLAESITPDMRAGDHAQAMMDLGSMICTPRAPMCGQCPLSGECMAYRSDVAGDLPRKQVKPPKPQRSGTAFWVERDGHVLLVRRSGSGILAGMRGLPDDGWSARSDGSGELPATGPWQLHKERVAHVFTHLRLDLRIASYKGADPSLVHARIDSAAQWWPLVRIDDAGLPTLYAKAARLVMNGRRGKEVQSR